MSGLCGWISSGECLVDPEEAIRAMALSLPQYGVEVSEDSSDGRHGLALRSRSDEGHWFSDPEISVAVEGYVVWHHPRWAELAQTRGVAKAIAEAYREAGEELLQQVYGTFVLAIVDKVAGRALIGIDRLGVQGLCYAQGRKGELVFASTTDAVRAHPNLEARVRPQSLFNFLFFVDRIPAPETIYREQGKLLPGQCLVFDKERWQTKTYWQVPFAAASDDTFEGLAARLPDCLRAAVSRSLRGEAPDRVAAFLSGGLDSSTVTGLLTELSSGRAKSFTIGFDMEGFDEAEFASLAAEHFKTRHELHYVTAQDQLDALPKVAEIFDEPFANSSVIGAYVCALKAKESGIDMLLAGDGGDELFAGNSRYLTDGVFDHYRRIPQPIRKWLLEPVFGCSPSTKGPALLRKARNYIYYASMSVPQRLTMHNVFRGLAPEALFDPDLYAEIDPAAGLSRAEEIYAATTAGSKLQRMMSFDLRLTLADSDLRKVGRACELAGVRVKYPFLDEEVVSFAAAVPAHYLNRGNELRAFYKRAFADFLPKPILDKKKQGFGVPCLEFVDTHAPLRGFVLDCLASLRARRIFRESTLEQILSEIHKGNSRCHNGVTWDLTALELWFQSRSPSF